MTALEYYDYIDFSPMFEKIEKSGYKASFLAKQGESSHSAFNDIKNKDVIPSVKLISVVASYCHCPVSALVKFTGFETRDFLTSKEFIHPVNPEHKLTYQPLRDTVEKYKKDGQTIQDLYDKIPKMSVNNSKEHYEYMMSQRGIIIDKNTEVKTGKYIDKTGRMRRAGGLSSANRAKINRDESVSFRIVYDICKILRCNVDFVLGWK